MAAIGWPGYKNKSTDNLVFMSNLVFMVNMLIVIHGLHCATSRSHRLVISDVDCKADNGAVVVVIVVVVVVVATF